MATFKTLIKGEKRKDGTYNVKIRLIHDRDTRFISTPFYVASSEVTKKMNIKNQQVIDASNELIKKYRTICNTVGDRLNGMSVDQIKDLITKDYSGKWSLDFVDYGRQVIEKLKNSGHTGNARTYEVALNSLVRFLGCDKLDVLDINTKFIQSYIDWIESTPSNSNRVKGGRAASLYISNIKALYNKAKVEYNDEDTGTIRIPYSPFVKVKVPTAPLSRKRALSIDQIQQIIKLQDRKSYQNRISLYNSARDMFTLSFCLMEMNTADLYSCVNCVNGNVPRRKIGVQRRRKYRYA